MAQMNINDGNLDALYQMASKFLGYSGPKTTKALEDFAKSSPAAAAKLGTYSSAMAKGGMVRGLAKGGPSTMGMGGVGEAEGSVQVWFYNGRQYSSPQAAQNARNRDLAATAPAATPTATTTTPTTTTTTTPGTDEPPVNTYDVKSGKPTDESDPFYQENLDAYNQYKTSLSSGGTIDLKQAQQEVAVATKKLADIAKVANENPDDVAAQEALEDAQKEYATAQTNLNVARTQLSTTAGITGLETVSKILSDPTTVAKGGTFTGAAAPEAAVAPAAVAAQVSAPSVSAPTVEAETVSDIESVGLPDTLEANTFEASKISDDVIKELEDLQAAKGTVSEEGLVRGQLEILMDDFENDGTPPWASGAMRAAMGVMQSRGLGASSVAGQAVVQAAMESAIGIAAQDAKTVAQFELQNLTNEQQTLIFKTQQRIMAMTSDQAAENAARQFNAASQNQTDQFMADINSTIARFNADQINAIRQFNSGQKNSAIQLNAQLKAQTDQFNASNALIVAQANAQLRQETSIANLQAQTQVTMANVDAQSRVSVANAQAAAEVSIQNAKMQNDMTQKALDDLWQRERDAMAYAFSASESAKDRNLAILLADKELDAVNTKINAAEDAAKTETLLGLADTVLGWF